MKKILLVIGLSAAAFVGLQYFNTKPAKAPERHPNIPLNATWAGGVDGGYWYQTSQASGVNTFHIKIYNEYTGEIQVDDLFELHSNCSIKGLDSETVTKNISSYNGERIFLKIIRNDRYCSLTPKINQTTIR
jgi:hypothetical protein